jgi:RNA polymerase sigma factor (TIGR02999 family)
MNGPTGSGITALLREWRDGDHHALERLTPLVYRELYRVAKRHMAHENREHILQSTALINETYVQLCKLDGMDFRDRGHFFAVCARLMRRILTDYARSRLSAKRGGKTQLITFDENLVAPPEPPVDLVALDDALNALSKLDERQSRVVELRFFAGLSAKETGEVLDVSERTVKQDWQVAKLWLMRELEGRNDHGR